MTDLKARAAQPQAATVVGLSGALGALAVLGLAAAGGQPPTYVDDGAIALNLVAGKGFSLAFHGPEALTAAHAPLEPFILAAIHGILGVGQLSVVAVVVLRALAHGLMAILAYPIARRLMSVRFAVLVSVAVSAHPALIWFASNPAHLDRRITLSLPLLMLAIWACAVACERQRAKRSLVAGMAIGLAALSEPPLLLFAVPASLIAAAPASDWRRGAGTIAATALGVLLVVSPWLVRNAIVFGRFVPIRSSFGLLFWAGNNPQATGLWEDQEIMGDPERRPSRHGDLLVGGHPTTFNFRARQTLPPAVLHELTRLNEVERDHVLIPIALSAMWQHPGRFIRLTARRAFYLIALPPRRPGSDLQVFYARLVSARGPLGPGWAAHPEAVFFWGWSALRLYLAVSFAVAVIGAIRTRAPTALLIASLLLTWLFVFGITHCGYPEYRFTLEPFAVIGTAGVLFDRAKAEGAVLTAAPI